MLANDLDFGSRLVGQSAGHGDGTHDVARVARYFEQTGLLDGPEHSNVIDGFFLEFDRHVGLHVDATFDGGCGDLLARIDGIEIAHLRPARLVKYPPCRPCRFVRRRVRASS